MKVLKCEICGEIFFEDNNSDKDTRSFEEFTCVDCSEISSDISRSEENEGYGIWTGVTIPSWIRSFVSAALRVDNGPEFLSGDFVALEALKGDQTIGELSQGIK